MQTNNIVPALESIVATEDSVLKTALVAAGSTRNQVKLLKDFIFESIKNKNYGRIPDLLMLLWLTVIEHNDLTVFTPDKKSPHQSLQLLGLSFGELTSLNNALYDYGLFCWASIKEMFSTDNIDLWALEALGKDLLCCSHLVADDRLKKSLFLYFLGQFTLEKWCEESGWLDGQDPVKTVRKIMSESLRFSPEGDRDLRAKTLYMYIKMMEEREKGIQQPDVRKTILEQMQEVILMAMVKYKPEPALKAYADMTEVQFEKA